MKNKLLCFIVVILLLIYSFMGSSRDITSHFNFEDHNDKVNYVTIKDLKNNTYDTLDMEFYLIGVVAGEMPASFNKEALKAQAVAARSYAYNKILNSKGDYDLTTDASTQVHLTIKQMQDKWGDDFEKYYNIIKDVILETKNEVLTYDGSIISAYYFAMGNGSTEDSLSAFGTSEPYLVSVNSYENIKDKNYVVNYTYSLKEFCQLLDINCNNGIDITNVNRSNSDRIISLDINNIHFSGTNLKYLLNLRSNDITINISDKVYITTTGWGHGVGMSQYGAQNMASDGYNYKEILSHYYTGISFSNVNSII